MWFLISNIQLLSLRIGLQLTCKNKIKNNLKIIFLLNIFQLNFQTYKKTNNIFPRVTEFILVWHKSKSIGHPVRIKQTVICMPGLLTIISCKVS